MSQEEPECVIPDHPWGYEVTQGHLLWKLTREIWTCIQAGYEALTPLQQYQFQQLRTLASTSCATWEKATAITGLGNTADESVLPILAPFLSDAELMESTQAAMWSIFLRCTVSYELIVYLRVAWQGLGNLFFLLCIYTQEGALDLLYRVNLHSPSSPMSSAVFPTGSSCAGSTQRGHSALGFWEAVRPGIASVWSGIPLAHNIF